MYNDFFTQIQSDELAELARMEDCVGFDEEEYDYNYYNLNRFSTNLSFYDEED